MNISVEYSETLTELDIILRSLDVKLIEKIPVKLRKFVQTNKSKEYVPKFNINTQNLYKDDLKLKTRELLAYIYRNYLCDEEERNEYDFILKKNESKYQEEINTKYSADNLFKNRQQYNQSNNIPDNYKLIEYKKTNFLRKIIEKIQKFF